MLVYLLLVLLFLEILKKNILKILKKKKKKKNSENDKLNGHFQSFFIYFFFRPPDPISEKKNPVNQLIKKNWHKYPILVKSLQCLEITSLDKMPITLS